MDRACRDAAVKLQEAFMYRHHPQWMEAVRLLRDGRIGDLVAVQSWFTFYNDEPMNIRNRPENGRGAIMDVGCYSINFARMLFGDEPARIEEVIQRDADMGIDILSSAVLGFPGGGQFTFTCSTRAHDRHRDDRVPCGGSIHGPSRVVRSGHSRLYAGAISGIGCGRKHACHRSDPDVDSDAVTFQDRARRKTEHERRWAGLSHR